MTEVEGCMFTMIQHDTVKVQKSSLSVSVQQWFNGAAFRKRLQKRFMNGTVVFLLSVLLHVYMMKCFHLPST